MAKIAELDQAAFDAWVAARPECIQTMCRKLPPDRLYKMKSTGHRVTLHSYSEDGTVTVDITGQYNCIVMDRQVFGIDADDLEECDLPDSNEVIGTLLTEPEEVDGFIANRVEEMHRNGEKHNESRCRLCSPASGEGGK